MVMWLTPNSCAIEVSVSPAARVGVMHKFKIGARLFPTRLDVREGAYVVIKRLPMRDGEFEYQIKSVTELDERVVRESELRPNPIGRTSRPPAH